jgi:septal ring factor EnvC (AmiA/AmiB activator)
VADLCFGFSELIPQLGDLERITEEKLVQLDTLRAIYNQFAPLTKEKEDHKSSMEILSPPRASQLSATKADLSRLRQNFSAIVAESASRQSEIAKERQALSADKAAVADEQKLILMLMLKLSEQYEKNEGKINDIAAKETELARESEDRKNVRNPPLLSLC